jgi:hypothetical protein
MQLAPRPDNYANQFHTYDLDVGKKVIAKLIKNRLNNLSETNSHIEKLKNRNIDKELKNLKNLDTFVRNFFPVLIYYNFDQISEIYNDMKIKSNWNKVVNNIRLYPELGINYFAAKSRFNKAKENMLQRIPYLGKGIPRAKVPYLGEAVPRERKRK